MKVTILSSTPKAAQLLLFTKNTRLNMTPGLMEDIASWPPERIAEELRYMATTIRSSWEFVDVVFLVEGASRACAQQITRTRNASYAMQSQRVVDARGIGVVRPEFDDPIADVIFDRAANAARTAYADLRDVGVSAENARAILPMNSECNLVAKYNLRAFADLVAARSSLRAQGEYAAIVREMRRLVEELWPWTGPFFESPHDAAIAMLEEAARTLGVVPGEGTGWQIAKAIDLLRKG